MRRAVRRDFGTGVCTGDRADVYRAVRAVNYSLLTISVLRISRALELRIKLRVELRAERYVELRAEPRVEILSRA